MPHPDVIERLETDLEPAARLAAVTLFSELSQNAQHLAHQHPLEGVDPETWEELGVPYLMTTLFEALAVELATAAVGWSEVLIQNATEGGR